MHTSGGMEDLLSALFWGSSRTDGDRWAALAQAAGCTLDCTGAVETAGCLRITARPFNALSAAERAWWCVLDTTADDMSRAKAERML